MDLYHKIDMSNPKNPCRVTQYLVKSRYVWELMLAK